MSDAEPVARQVLAIVSIVLAQADRVDHVSRPLTVASLAGMVAAGTLAGRPAAARIAGAARLLCWQIAALLVQMGLLTICALRAAMA